MSAEFGQYKSYQEYKESGIEWLGEVPTHWDIFALKRTIDRCTNGIWGDEPDGENDIVVLRVADFDRTKLIISDEKLTYRAITKNERRNRLLKKGDLLIEKSGGGDKTLVGCVVLFEKNYPAVTSNFVAKMSPKYDFHSTYLNYAFNHLYSGNVNFPSIKQTTGIQNLDSESYLMEYFCFPPKADQTNIASFLDYETARIDRLIAKQQQLIELLKEKRQAVISHVVTKGLNPDVPMKDSGVEWLGQVPEHWVVRRLKHTATLQSGIPKGKDLSGKTTVSVPMLRVANVQDGYIDLTNVHELELEPHEVPRFSLQAGDVLMNEGGDNDKLGRGAVWNADIKPCIHQNHVFAIRVKDIEPEWLSWLTGSSYAKHYFFSVAKQSTNLASISSSSIKETPLIIPPKDERHLIMEYLEKIQKKFKSLEELAIREVVLLREHRTALISSVVTGKIDVRDWVLPTQL